MKFFDKLAPCNEETSWCDAKSAFEASGDSGEGQNRGGSGDLIPNLIGMKELLYVPEDSVPEWWLCCDYGRTE